MTIRQALESLTAEQRLKVMTCFNNLEPFLVLLEDEQFLAVHFKPERAYEIVDESTYWLLGKYV